MPGLPVKNGSAEFLVVFGPCQREHGGLKIIVRNGGRVQLHFIVVFPGLLDKIDRLQASILGMAMVCRDDNGAGIVKPQFLQALKIILYNGKAALYRLIRPGLGNIGAVRCGGIGAVYTEQMLHHKFLFYGLVHGKPLVF